MKSRDYISSVFQQLCSSEDAREASYNGAFLQAMLAVIREVDSPLKEQTIVSLALLKSRGGRLSAAARKRIA